MQTTTQTTNKKASRSAILTAIDAAKGAGQQELVDSLTKSLEKMDELNIITSGAKKKRNYSPEQQQLVDYLNDCWDNLKEDENVTAALKSIVGSTFETLNKKGETVKSKITNVRLYFDTVPVKSEQ